MAVPPRRARLKRCQSEVNGLSFAEQKMLEKALKESLKDNYRKDSSSDSSEDSDSTVSPQKPSIQFTGYRNDKLNCNIAKKSASKMPLKPSKQLHKPGKVRKPCADDPMYRPCLSGPNTSLPPKHSIERNSKAITNIKLDLSLQSDELPSSLSSETDTSSSPYSCFSDNSNDGDDNEVIVIDSSSDDISSIDSCHNKKPLLLKPVKDNSFKDGSLMTKQSKKIYNLPTRHGLLAAAVKKRPIKTQKILFKAVKKSSIVVPSSSKRPFEQAIDTTKHSKKPACSSPKTGTQLRMKQPSVKKKPIVPSQIIRSRYSSDDEESWSSVTDTDERSSTLRNSKDSDKSFYQAQRKFAAYSSPSNQYNDEPSTMVETGVTHSIPSTEDFLLFLCLRSSGKVPEPLKVFNTPWTCSHQFQS